MKTERLCLLLCLLAASQAWVQCRNAVPAPALEVSPPDSLPPLPEGDSIGRSLATAALSLTQDKVQYDPDYFSIPYPMGDVPPDKGVCTDVVVRAYRKLGVDLQQLIHEDMRTHFELYPKRWGLKRPDTNIDHRRVPNLQVFFARKGSSLPLSRQGQDYLPGDLVTWRLPGGHPHIGIVSGQPSADAARYQIVHNIGGGQVLEDCLFEYPITGHYRFFPDARSGGR